MNKPEYLALITSPISIPLNLTHGDARSTSWISFFPNYRPFQGKQILPEHDRSSNSSGHRYPALAAGNGPGQGQ